MSRFSLDCEPVFDYGRTEARWSTQPGLRGGHRPRGRGRRPAPPGHRPPGGLRGPRRARPDHLARGRTGLRRPLLAALPVVVLGGVLGRADAPRHRRRGVRAHERAAEYAGLDQPGRVPRASLAEPPPAQRPHPQRLDLRPHRGAAGRGHHLAARDPRRQPQLRLPLHLDPRRHLHLWGLYTLGFEREANDFFYFVADACDGADSDLQIMYGVGGEKELPEQELEHLNGYEDSRPVRVGNAAATQRQHDVWGPARLGLPARQVAGLPARAGLADAEARRRVPSPTGTSPTRASGRSGARRGISPPPS